MSKYRLAILWGILIACLTSFILLSAGQNNDFKVNEEEYPVICAVCAYACSVWIDSTQMVYPGHHAILAVKAKSERSIGRINIRATYPTGLSYFGLDTTGTVWKGGFTNNSSGTSIDIQCTTAVVTDTLSRGGWYHLFNLIMDFDDTVGFSKYRIITTSANYPEFGETHASSVCSGKQKRSFIQTRAAGWKIWADTTTGYSYQARDSINDPAKYIPISVKIKFRPTFPVDGLKFAFRLDSLCPLSPVDSIINTTYVQNVYNFGGLRTLWAYPSGTTFIPACTTAAMMDTGITLITYRFKGADYGGNYNASASCSSGVNSNYIRYFTTNWHLRCDSSSVTCSFAADSCKKGGIRYPPYACTTTATNEYAPWSGNVTVPVKADHSFWSQYYIYYLDYDSTCLHLQSVTTPAGSSVQGVALSYNDTTGNKITVQLESDATAGKFIQPQTNATMFNLNFTASDSFMYTGSDTTWIRFRTTDRTNKVKDYFHAAASKIERDNSDGTTYFYLSDGVVTVPPHFDVKLDTVNSESSVVWVPLRLTRVETNNYNKITFSITLSDKNARFYTGDATGAFSPTGDFSFLSLTKTTTNSNLTITGYTSFGEFDATGIIGYVRCADPGGLAVSYSDLNFDYFRTENTSGNSIFDASKMVNGRIYLGGWRKINNDVENPFTFSLTQNYPNPFNLKTMIAYTIPQSGNVKLEVFDILGRHVKTGVNSYLDAGEHQYIWDGTNDQGNTVGTGFYIYNLQSGEFKQTKKMLLLK